MELIDRAALRERCPIRIDNYDEVHGSREFVLGIETVFELIEAMPTIEAVPLEPLCEWLERNATMDCDGCRATIGSCEDDDVDEKVCNSRWRWKIMLTKWMEGQNG